MSIVIVQLVIFKTSRSCIVRLYILIAVYIVDAAIGISAVSVFLDA